MKQEKERWSEALLTKGDLTANEVEELEGHLEDAMEDLSHLPLSQEERFFLAANRIGHPADLGDAYAAVPGRAPLGGGVFRLVVLGICAYLLCTRVSLLLGSALVGMIVEAFDMGAFDVVYLMAMFEVWAHAFVILGFGWMVMRQPGCLLRLSSWIEIPWKFALLLLTITALSGGNGLLKNWTQKRIERGDSIMTDTLYTLIGGATLCLTPCLIFVGLALLLRAERRKSEFEVS